MDIFDGLFAKMNIGGYIRHICVLTVDLPSKFGVFDTGLEETNRKSLINQICDIIFSITKANQNFKQRHGRDKKDDLCTIQAIATFDSESLRILGNVTHTMAQICEQQASLTLILSMRLNKNCSLCDKREYAILEKKSEGEYEVIHVDIFRYCKGCKELERNDRMWYCSRKCQKIHWKKCHREVCPSVFE